jgi:hypothetical protein
VGEGPVEYGNVYGVTRYWNPGQWELEAAGTSSLTPGAEVVSPTCVVPGAGRRFPILARAGRDCKVRLSLVEEYFINGGGGNSNAPSCAE